MGWPQPLSIVRDFIFLFSDIVTAVSSNPCDWIARKGEHSIFELVLLLAPKVTESTGISLMQIYI
jgi:hypothetical protein